jgi:hypothetical protein
MKLEDKLEVVIDYNNQYRLGELILQDGVIHAIVKREVLEGPTRSYYTIYKPSRKFPIFSILWALLRVRLRL